jgi:hypothetical protein
MVLLVALFAGAVTGCGCFYLGMKGELAPAPPPSAKVQKAPEKPAAQEMAPAPAAAAEEGGAVAAG